VLLRPAPLTNPKDLAWFLASYAREARARSEQHPIGSLTSLKSALEESLGLHFEGEKGDHFFRSTLVQTLFYGIFSAWVLWSREHSSTSNDKFQWRLAAWNLRVPVLVKLFSEVSNPASLNASQLTEILDLAGDTLDRVDRHAFFSVFSQQEAVAYFYEPFLEAFDPELRKDLGVWYTPKEIVLYMVERIDHLLRTELHQPLGLASPEVFVLDPCCGTGAYLTCVLDRIHRTLAEKAGDDSALVPNALREAALSRVFGFELLPAPFVIAHMQIAALLSRYGAPLNDNTQHAQVFLTNALTGWVPAQDPKISIFPELQKEKEDAEAIKRRPSILVILGNPPYNGYAGIAIGEERDLSDAYRNEISGLPKPQGQGLNELYVRFFRIAERRIVANPGGQGIVSFISNSSWLDGLSHPSMRHRYLHTFQQLYIDNLNGDKYRTGKLTPEGKPDPSAFSTPQNREGIQVGTAISTLVRTSATAPNASIHLRDLWGAGKLSHLERESRREIEPNYNVLSPVAALGLKFADRLHSADYTTWPRLTELFPKSFPGVKTSRDPLLVDIDKDRLVQRMQQYLGTTLSDSEITALVPPAMARSARFDPTITRQVLQKRGFRYWQILRYSYRPFDLRWVYWETIADRPPHRAVRACLCIRLLQRMSVVEMCTG
jgi:predicted helicase